MPLSDEEASNKIKSLISQDESFSDVPKELMQAKHSIWEQVLNQSNNK